MYKYLLILLLLLVPVNGCSSLGSAAAGALTGASGKGVDAELTVGTKTEEMHNNVGNTNWEAQTIQNVQQVPFVFMLLMVLGWLLPSPQEIWKGFVKILPWSK